MAKQADTEQSRRRVQSIEVGFRVLRVLRMADGPLPLREIAALAEMPPSKVHLYLVSFVRENMAYQDPDTGHYGLGSFAIQLGLSAIRQLDVVGLASDMLADLRDRTECAVYLSLWGDQGPCIVAKEDGALQGAFAVRLGYILPLATTATGLVFLAYLGRSESERALSAQAAFDARGKAARTIHKRDLDKAVVDVRRRGFASTTGLLHRNFSGLSAPVFDYGDRLAAAVTMLGPIDYMTRERQEDFAGLLLDTTSALSQRLGAPVPVAERATG